MRLRAISVGAMAARTLAANGTGRGTGLGAGLRAGHGTGRVAAVFARSFYVTLGGAWLCVGPPGLGEGPLNVLVAPDPGGDTAAIATLAGWLSVGDPAVAADGALRIGQDAVIALAGAPVFAPAPPSGWNCETLRAGLAEFEAALPAVLPEEGLARLLRPRPTDAAEPAVLRMARAPASALTAAPGAGVASHAGAMSRLAEDLKPLIGLGPGLTPSGDDVIGGALVALRHGGLATLGDDLWAALAPHVPAGTNDISAAHLSAAAEGFPGAALHDLVVAVMTGDARDMAARIARIDAIGHTSGWDATAGAILVLRAMAQRPLPTTQASFLQ